ncbi:MAG TPA: response regulator [Luteitalea sp.]|nr:response regulator [Luteitalea sp.]
MIAALARADDSRDHLAALVLLVDDYADTRELYGTYLRLKGYRIEEAEDGIDAIAKAVDLRPAVIVMDLAMPNMNGWEATRLLKADPRTMAIPIICLTAHGQLAERSRAMAAGSDGFLTKPCLPRVVGQEIRRVLG